MCEGLTDDAATLVDDAYGSEGGVWWGAFYIEIFDMWDYAVDVEIIVVAIYSISYVLITHHIIFIFEVEG